MSQAVTNWVWSHSLSVNAGRIVLLAIAHEADRDGKAEMSVAELARKCRLGERTVQMAVRDLVTLGELSVWPKAGAHRRNGYQVTTSKGAISAPLTPAGYAPRHLARGADAAGAQILRGAESAGSKPDTAQVRPSKGAESAPMHFDPHEVSTTGISEAEVKDVPASESRADITRVCAHLADRIEGNGSKRPTVTENWRKAARLMLDRDGRTEQQLIAAIDWCQDSEFWRANILSMPKLREKYDQLRLQASRNGNGTPISRRQSETDAMFARQMARAQAREEASDANGVNPAHPVHPRALPAAGHG